MDKEQILSEVSEFLNGARPSVVEYEALTDTPYSYLQLRRIFGSWDRTLSLLPVVEVVAPVVTKDKVPTVTKDVK